MEFCFLYKSPYPTLRHDSRLTLPEAELSPQEPARCGALLADGQPEQSVAEDANGNGNAPGGQRYVCSVSVNDTVQSQDCDYTGLGDFAQSGCVATALQTDRWINHTKQIARVKRKAEFDAICWNSTSSCSIASYNSLLCCEIQEEKYAKLPLVPAVRTAKQMRDLSKFT